MESSERGIRSGGFASEVRLALEVPRWALRFYRRHLGVVVGISLIPSAQRAIGQLWGDQSPAPLGLVGELVTAAARVILLVVVVRLAFGSEDRLRGLAGREAWARVRRFARRHWRSLLVQLGLIALAAVVFDRIPEALVAPRVPESARPLYWAILLAVKNPTIIAFTLVWEVGILRQMLLDAPARATEEAVRAPREVDVGRVWSGD